MKALPKGSIAWALYDWANTGYAMIGLALIYPRMFREYWGVHLAADKQTFWFTLTVAVASVFVAILAPFLGSMAEIGGLRKRLLIRFAIIGIVACACLSLVDEGHFYLAGMIYVVGTVCFYSGNLFFDSMLERVSTPRSRHFISGMGFSFGYAAGFILLVIIAMVVANHERLGFASDTTAMRILFLIAAVWWFIFMLPLVFCLKEPPHPDRPRAMAMARMGALQTWVTFREILGQRAILWFLIAYLFYIDGVNTIITTASNYGSTLGFSSGEIITAFFIVQIFGVPCAVIFGLLGQRFGPRRLIFSAIMIYLLVTVYGATIRPEPALILGFTISPMYVLAAMIGSVQGGIQALSRSYFTSLIPEGKNVAYFGFYSMIGKSAAILGPLLMGLTALLFNRVDDPHFSTRLGLASVAILFVLGALCLMRARPDSELRA